MRGRVYLAGPMSGIEDNNHPLFNRVAGLLRDADWHVENPAEFEPIISAKLSSAERLAFFLREDIERLSRCDGIVLLPGWSESTGANCELFVAQILDLTTYVWEDEVVRSEPHLYADLDLMLDHINEANWPGEAL